jgi:hypothetical protein
MVIKGGKEDALDFRPVARFRFFRLRIGQFSNDAEEMMLLTFPQ